MTKSKTGEISVLIPDGESHILLYVVNCFAHVKGVKLYIMSNKKGNPMRFSRYVHKFLYYNDASTDLFWINTIDAFVEKYKIDIILPVFETGIKRIIEHQGALTYQGKLCLLPHLKDFIIAGNKGQLYLHLKKYGINCPDSIIVCPQQSPEIIDLDFPVIVKPVAGYGGGMGVAILKNREELLQYYKNHNYICDTIIQQFIKGYDVSCNVLCKAGNIKAYSSQRGRYFSKSELSPQTGFDFINDQALYKQTESLMQSLNWSGVANIDWRYDENDKQFKVIEINTRFWLNTDASAMAGVNFPYLYCLMSLNKHYKNPHVNLISFFSLKGLSYQIKKNPLFVFKVKYIYNHTALAFVIKDPLPIAYKYFWRTKNIIAKRLASVN